MIVDSSGTRYKTNPKKDDTDGDELKDNEEVEVKRSLEKGKDKYGKEVYKWYHHMKSDPLEQDSDGDGLDDKLDNAPLDSTVHAFVIYETVKNDADLKAFPADDLKYADLSKDDLLKIENMTQDDFGFEENGKFYEYHPDSYKDNWIRFSKLVSTGEMEDVAADMFNHFMDGSGSDYYNDVLTKNIENHDNTKIYVTTIKLCFESLINENKGNLEPLHYNKEKYISESNNTKETIENNEDAQNKRKSESLMVKRMLEIGTLFPYKDYGFWNWAIKPVTLLNSNQPVYDDYLSGLGICVDALYGNRIEVSSYQFDGKKYKYTLHFVMYDVFGLGSDDLTDPHRAFNFGKLTPFRVWYILQHYNKYNGRYKPFITYMEFDRTFEGEIE